MLLFNSVRVSSATISGVGTEEYTSLESVGTTIVHEQPSNTTSETFQILGDLSAI